MNEVELTYYGEVTAKKNSKQIIWNRRTGSPMIISSRRAKSQEGSMVEAFASDAYLEGWECGLPRAESTFKITINIWNKDKRRRDLDNQATAILDALVLAGVIPDDNVAFVPWLKVEYKGIDKENPRAVIKIKEIAWQV